MRNLQYFRENQDAAPEWAVPRIESGSEHRSDYHASLWKMDGGDFLLKGKASIAIRFANGESLVFWGHSIRISANRRYLTIDGEPRFEIPMLKSQQEDMNVGAAEELAEMAGYHPFGLTICHSYTGSLDLSQETFDSLSRSGRVIEAPPMKQTTFVFFRPDRKIPLEDYGKMTEKQRRGLNSEHAVTEEVDSEEDDAPATPGMGSVG